MMETIGNLTKSFSWTSLGYLNLLDSKQGLRMKLLYFSSFWAQLSLTRIAASACVRIAAQSSNMLNFTSIICNRFQSSSMCSVIFSAGVSSHALRCVQAGLLLDSNLEIPDDVAALVRLALPSRETHAARIQLQSFQRSLHQWIEGNICRKHQETMAFDTFLNIKYGFSMFFSIFFLHVALQTTPGEQQNNSLPFFLTSVVDFDLQVLPGSPNS